MKDEPKFHTGWGCDSTEVWPINDTKQHKLTADVRMNEECWCNPFYDEYGILIHNSDDKREEYERGKPYQ